MPRRWPSRLNTPQYPGSSIRGGPQPPPCLDQGPQEGSAPIPRQHVVIDVVPRFELRRPVWPRRVREPKREEESVTARTGAVCPTVLLGAPAASASEAAVMIAPGLSRYSLFWPGSLESARVAHGTVEPAGCFTVGRPGVMPPSPQVKSSNDLPRAWAGRSPGSHPRSVLPSPGSQGCGSCASTEVPAGTSGMAPRACGTASTTQLKS